MKKLIIVANRLPSTFLKREGNVVEVSTVGGMATGVGSIFPYTQKDLWVGWPGYVAECKDEQDAIRKMSEKKQFVPVFLSSEEIINYYEGFCNQAIWPNFHSFHEFVKDKHDWWEYYVKVNEKFCDAIVPVADSDTRIWINDFHLMLLPMFLKKKNVQSKIGFFLHTPFPSYQTIKGMPHQEELMDALLYADSIGVYLPEYRKNFIATTKRSLAKARKNGYPLKPVINDYPIGIDYDKYNMLAQRPSVAKRSVVLRSSLNSDVVILSVDRLDYTKGIPQKLLAYEKYLTTNPEKKTCLFLVVVPSRENIPENQCLKSTIEQLVNRINNTFGDTQWKPICYHYNSFAIDEISAFYRMADIMLITSITDGMNLVSKEFVASKPDDRGILILSKNAGAAEELSDSLLINPVRINSIVRAISKSVEQVSKKDGAIRKMRVKIKKRNVKWWAKEFINSI